MLNIDLLKQLTSNPSPSGYTHYQIKFIKNYLTDLGYNPFMNQKGNLFVEVKGVNSFLIKESCSKIFNRITFSILQSFNFNIYVISPF